jgi:hypothetical protein
VTTLANLRAKLNGEIGVATDADATPWSVAVRNNAIADGYAALWRVGIWRPLKQDFATVTDQWVYPLTSIRRLDRLEVLDTTSRVLERPRGVIEPDDTTNETYQLRLSSPLASGYTLRVRGYTAYVSTFANDAAVDDLPAEHNRIPLLKAKAILYRVALGAFARYGERQAAPPEMNLTVDQLIGLVSAAEREFTDEARILARLRTRTGQARGI